MNIEKCKAIQVKSKALCERSLNEEETKSSFKQTTLAQDSSESSSLSESDFGSISEGGSSLLIQRVPQLSCPGHMQLHSSEEEREIYESVTLNDAERCKELLSKPSRPSLERRWENNNTLLHIAAERGHLKVCEVLLDYSETPLINCLNHFSSSAIHLSCKENHLPVVQLLVRSGADLNAIDIYGNTPLHISTSLGHKNLVTWLVTRGPNILIKDKTGRTAEELASQDIALIFKKFLKRTVVVAGPCFSDDQKISFHRSKTIANGENLTPANFVVLKELGKGSFGEVFLVVKSDTSQLFAMKVLQKEKILRQNLIKYAVTERNVLSYIRHPFIVSLKYALQTNEKLFLFLDYCPGGDLASHLHKEKKFTEYRASIYISEIVLALEELHKRDIIYRDLKPDNIVLDKHGHALLTDFGLSKEKVYDNYQATSFCGSLAYLAPEVLKRQGHGKALDWYLLGVVLYEMVVGTPPYFSSNKQELFNNIQRGKLKLPINLSSEVKDLIKSVIFIQLLQRDPSKRLGAVQDAEEIKKHPFFKGINWEAALNKQLHPPRIPLSEVPKSGIPAEKIYGPLFFAETNKVSGWTFVSEA
jgi:protein-serine/threonine kinase